MHKIGNFNNGNVSKLYKIAFEKCKKKRGKSIARPVFVWYTGTKQDEKIPCFIKINYIFANIQNSLMKSLSM